MLPMIIGVLAVVSLSPACGESFERFAAWAESLLPKRGSIILQYADLQVPGRTAWMGYDFGSGAAYLIADGYVMGVEPGGMHFRGYGYRGQVNPIPAEKSLADSMLDFNIPAVLLRGLARDRENFVAAETTPDGGWKVTYRFVEGRRGLRPENMPGGASFPREHMLCFITIASDGTVVEVQRDRPGERPWRFEPAAERPGGVAIAAKLGDMVPVNIEFIAEGDPSRFTLPAVEKFATEARTDAYRAIQNIDVSAPLPPDVVHMVPLRRRTEVLWGRVFMIAGASAIAIGAAVWWFRRRTGA